MATELGGPRRNDPRREPSEPPVAEEVRERRGQREQVAEFRTSSYRVSLPAVVITALITAMSGALVAWINKPVPAAALPLTPEQSAALIKCGALSQDVSELKVTVRWIEPQIGVLLARTDPAAHRQ